MINPICNITSFIQPSEHINFRSNDSMSGMSFQNRMPQPLLTDVFVRTGSVNGSQNTLLKIEELMPFAKVKKLAPNQRETKRNKTIEEEKKHISNTVTKRTEYNTRQLRAAGVSERDVKKYLTIDGHVNTEGKRILRENGKSYQ